MAFIATAIIGSGALTAGASLFGASQQASAAKQAQSTIASSTQNAIAQLLGLVQQGQGAISANTATGAADIGSYTGQAVSSLAPFVGGGTAALPTLINLLTGGGGPNASANIMSTLSNLPGFQFAQNWGMRGINNAASTSGLGGNVLKAGADYSSGLASQQYGNIVQMLQGLVGTGASAAQGQAGALSSGGLSLGSLFGGAGQAIGSLLGGAGSTIGGLTSGAGQNIASAGIGGANATAAGITGAASGIGSSLSSFANLSALNNLLGGKLFGGGGIYAPAAAGVA